MTTFTVNFKSAICLESFCNYSYNYRSNVLQVLTLETYKFNNFNDNKFIEGLYIRLIDRNHIVYNSYYTKIQAYQLDPGYYKDLPTLFQYGIQFGINHSYNYKNKSIIKMQIKIEKAYE